ncbi:hypothetical protein MTR67_000693 [Solanum verrucosum]|uniref:Reverse transcriptase domain-containing protein n=1 Tax=Solanum verrucosum TaxID=315347 RepID=A0AAF0PM43_SOLVR|nr:hypothetical protein MTR67_000693 [Solanum verrucosum]
MGSAASSLPSPNIEVIRSGPCLSYHQKCKLTTEVSDLEIVAAIKGMPLDKTPGVDGFPIEFFIQHWSLIKTDVIDAVMEFLKTGRMLKAFSCTAISLVPKVSTPTQVKRVIGTLVSPAQTAFIEGRSIIDNIMFSHELLKWYSRKGLSPRCVMKIDLRKAYDSIEWSFLKSVLAELGFPFKFIQWVMECISSVSYSLVLFGGLTKPFKGRRGIRQGDPYLFVNVMEYLQRELTQVGQNKDFKFHPRCKKLGVMHICFADDLLMFCKADMISIQLLRGAFQRFSDASGLQANTEKSQVYMAGVKPNLKQEILTTLGYLEGSIHFNYLGVPLSSKKLTITQCLPIIEKVTEKLRCWSAKLFD